MNSKIKVMDINLSNKIAAGEVVETLMNVVKELVENSIDAGSSYIKVDLVDSGTKEIIVTDDGIGMNREDAVTSLERHATSKLYTDEDLFHIETLGFRGEALPSIASVSKMIIETSNGEEGTTVTVEGGNIKDISSSHLRKGTKIAVKDIFYNTPARLKYLKNLHTELANISFYLTKMALANPNIRFVLTNNEKVLINTDGSGNLLKVINNIYGLEVAKKMIKIEASDDDYDINGYISYPEVNRSSRGFITVLVNGRYIKNTNIIKVIQEAYHTYMMVGKSPIVVLNIETDPWIVDVNVHPTKMDIKFSKFEELKELLTKTIDNALKKLILVPEIKEENKPIANINKITTINTEVDFKTKEEVKPVFEEISFDFEVNEGTEIYNKEEQKTEKLKNINAMGIIAETYIFGENEDGMYIIDQHAAHERINYEKILKNMKKKNIDQIELLVPIKLTFTAEEYIKLKEKAELIESIGIEYEEFGINTIIIRKHPKWINKNYAEEILRKIIEIIITEKSFEKDKFNDRLAAHAACRMSIKAHDYISLEEANKLLEELLKCDNPYHCPHGRPVMINYSYYELEKLFKRVV